LRPHHEHLAVAGRVRWRSLPYAVCCRHPLLPPVQTAASGVDTCHQPAEESRALRRVKPQRHRRGRDCAARELVKRPFSQIRIIRRDNSQLMVNRVAMPSGVSKGRGWMVSSSQAERWTPRPCWSTMSPSSLSPNSSWITSGQEEEAEAAQAERTGCVFSASPSLSVRACFICLNLALCGRAVQGKLKLGIKVTGTLKAKS
jgi:hypothetical protein